MHPKAFIKACVCVSVCCRPPSQEPRCLCLITMQHTHTSALAKQQIPPPLSLRPHHTRLSQLLFNTKERERDRKKKKRQKEVELWADRQSGPSRFLLCACLWWNKGRLYQDRGYGTSLKRSCSLGTLILISVAYCMLECVCVCTSLDV